MDVLNARVLTHIPHPVVDSNYAQNGIKAMYQGRVHFDFLLNTAKWIFRMFFLQKTSLCVKDTSCAWFQARHRWVYMQKFIKIRPIVIGTFRFLKDALVVKLSGKMCQGGLIFAS